MPPGANLIKERMAFCFSNNWSLSFGEALLAGLEGSGKTVRSWCFQRRPSLASLTRIVTTCIPWRSVAAEFCHYVQLCDRHKEGTRAVLGGCLGENVSQSRVGRACDSRKLDAKCLLLANLIRSRNVCCEIEIMWQRKYVLWDSTRNYQDRKLTKSRPQPIELEKTITRA